jgi:hypothetical protein
MKYGFNSKVQIGPEFYDVQTEDRGASHPFIDTLVLIQGRVVYRHSTSYEDLAASGALDQAILRARVEKQHREILEALRGGVLSLDKAAPVKKEGLAVRLLNAGSWLESGHVSLDIEVSSKGGGQPVTGAQVEAFIEGGAGAPESHFAQTDAEGRTSLEFPFPTLNESSLAALVIRAHMGEGLEELRYQLKPKRPNR